MSPIKVYPTSNNQPRDDIAIQFGAGDGVTKSQSIPREKEGKPKSKAQSLGRGQRVGWMFCGVAERGKKIRAVGVVVQRER